MTHNHFSVNIHTHTIHTQQSTKWKMTHSAGFTPQHRKALSFCTLRVQLNCNWMQSAPTSKSPPRSACRRFAFTLQARMWSWCVACRCSRTTQNISAERKHTRARVHIQQINLISRARRCNRLHALMFWHFGTSPHKARSNARACGCAALRHVDRGNACALHLS